MKGLIQNIGFPSLKGLFFNSVLGRLGPKKTTFAAVDIGTREIKALEVSNAEGVPVVTAFGRLPALPSIKDDRFAQEAMVDSLAKLFMVSDIQGREVITTISGDRVVSRYMKVPAMPVKELEQAVRFEAEQFTQTPVEDFIIRYLVLDESEAGGVKNLHLLLSMVPTAVVYQYYDIFLRAGLRIAAIDLQALSLWRVFFGLKNNVFVKGTLSVVDIGASSTHFQVVCDRKLTFIRTIPMGGNLLTAKLADHYGLAFETAEQMKEEKGELLTATEVLPETTPGNIEMDIILRDSLSGLIREIRRSLDYYTAQHQEKPVERIIISGGTSKLKGFAQFLAEAVGVPVDFGVSEIPGLPVARGENTVFDPAFTVVLGTSLREMV